MNIRDAKEQIKKSIIAYMTKDEDGEYELPLEKQRPIFLMGPPGIGKTAIMEQIASEMGIGLLSYSMTHHTRQSAIGLPVIKTKIYNGVECEVSEYTMSEIISSIYDLMEETGIKEGILFLDEINCVSETLTPVMLQFLQYKIFGKHQVPEGWIVVTAGNPPAYNQSVREFDIVTWDRLKRIDVEPDFSAWKEYAHQAGVHPSVLTYLEMKKSDFYRVESTIDGKNFVTARGWEDLSRMIQLYEKNQMEVDEQLVTQYIQNPRIAREFAVYYVLFRKYQSEYQADAILAGCASEDTYQKASEARFDERLSLIGLLLDSIYEEVKQVVFTDDLLKDLLEVLKEYQAELVTSDLMPARLLAGLATRRELGIQSGKKSGSMSRTAVKREKRLVKELHRFTGEIAAIADRREAFAKVKEELVTLVSDQKKAAADAGKHLENLFEFCEKAFGEGQELLVIVTELTANSYSAAFIGKYGCESYFRHNKDLLFYERKRSIELALEELE